MNLPSAHNLKKQISLGETQTQEFKASSSKDACVQDPPKETGQIKDN